MRNGTTFEVTMGDNESPVLDKLYESFRKSYVRKLNNNWDFKTTDGKKDFIKEVIEEIKKSWAWDLSTIKRRFDSKGNLLVFNNFRVEVDYFDTPGVGRESMNRFKITCWID